MVPLTIILPTYNGARFLGAQIESILAQTQPDFELLAVDDGSTDGSAAIIDDFARRDGRVRRLPSSGNLGQRGRLRQLAEAVTTEFLAFADQDDLWHPERNARLLDAIGDRAVAFGRSQLIDGEGRDLGRSLLDQIGIDPTRAGPLDSLLKPLVSAHAAVVRRSWLDLAVFSGGTHFDQQMGLEAMLSAGLIYVDDAVVFHRIHGGNQSNARVVGSGGPRLLSAYRLRTSTSFVLLERLSLLTVFDQVSKSMAVGADVRRAFGKAADACRYVWFQPMDFRPGKGRRLGAELHVLLDRYAESEEDLLTFQQRVRSVTRGQFSPVNIAGAVARYWGRQP